MAFSLPYSTTTLLLSVVCVLVLYYPAVISGKVYNNNAANSTFWEQQFLTLPEGLKAKEYLQYYTSIPHVAGTEGDYQTALYTKAKFEEFGFTNVVIEELQVLLTYPIKRLVEIVAPEEQKFVAVMKEPAVPLDPTSNNTESIDTFNGYAPSGNVTSQLVFANYGTQEDFQKLESIGVNVSGKIVIVKYGRVFRGVKAMIAQQLGAIGLLIYSDPADDGFKRGTVYPEGPWRPEQGVQRGSVQYLQVCPGNPYDNLDCVPEGTNITGVLIPSIPVQPLSWGDALPLLSGITNNAVPPAWGWSGGLNITYAVGPGPVEVHLQTEILFNLTTIWNVIATIEGQDPSKSVLIGNHRDAWVFGATDPNSGTAVMLEIARSFGELVSQGWQPKRNITFCSWDAEEYALVGSVGYAKQYKDILAANAIAYLNVDTAIGGHNFGATGTPSLRTIIEAAASEVPYPGNPNITLMEHWGADKLGVLGSGSDYTAFIHHLGIASFDCSFGGISSGVYHSIYDSFYWMETFGDPTWVFHQGMAQFFGLATMKLVDSTVLPYNYTNYAEKLAVYAQTIENMLNATAPAAPDVGFGSIKDSIQHFGTIAATVQQQQLSQNLEDAAGVSSLNNRVYMAERSFLYADGLPGRPFYKHVVQAPGIYSGYGADVFPGLTQAIRDQDWELASQQSQIIAQRITAASDALEGKQNPPEPGPKPKNKTAAIVVISIVVAVALIAVVGGAVYYVKNKKSQYVKV